MPQAPEILQVLEFAAFQPLVTLDFLGKLQMKQLHGISDALHLIIGETRGLEAHAMLRKPTLLRGETLHRLSILSLVQVIPNLHGGF